MSRFSLSIENGIKNAEAARKNLEEINSIFDELSQEIKLKTGGEVSFERASLGFLVEFANSSPDRSSKKKRGRLVLKSKKGNETNLAKWEQAADGYPFVIEFDGKRNDCWDEEGLIGVLGDIISTGYFWLEVNKLLPTEE